MKGRGNIKLFDRVTCTGFLKKVPAKWSLVIESGRDFRGHFYSKTWDGGKYNEEFVKVEFQDEYKDNTFFEVKEQDFTGVVIGFKDVETEGRLWAVTDDYPDGRQRPGYYNEVTKREPCAVVAYGDNRKHVVPMSCIIGAEDFGWLKGGD